MSLTIPNPDFVPNTTIYSGEVDADFAAVVAKFSKGINDTDITDGSLIDILMAASSSVQNYFASYTTAQPNGYTESGGLGPDNAGGLSHTITALVAYPKKTSTTPNKLVRVTKVATSHTYTANRDTYVDINTSGNFVFIELSNGAGTPAVSADSTRLMKVVSGAATLTVTDLRTLISAVSATAPKNYRFGAFPVYKTATTVALSSGAIDYGGQLLLQTGESSTVDITNNANFVSGTAAINQWQWLVGADNGAGGISLKFATSGPNASDFAGTSGVSGYDALWRAFSGVKYRYLGSVRTDGAGNVVKFYCLNKIVTLDQGVAALTAGAAAAYTAVSLAARMPSTSRRAILTLQSQNAAGNNQTDGVRIRPAGSTSTIYSNDVAGSGSASAISNVDTDASQQIEYLCVAPTTADIFVRGYEEAL